MFNAMLIYKPTDAAIAENERRRGAPLPREIHVHASGMTVALYAEGVDIHFPTINGVLERYHLTRADLQQVR